MFYRFHFHSFAPDFPQDQFDVIDFSDNEIRLLDNFPKMKRLTTLFFNNNYIFRIGNLGGNLSNLTTLILTNNRITSLSEVDNLASLTHLELLSLMDNPLTNHVHYRLYVIHKIPSLKCLDYQKITRSEREQSQRLFASNEGAQVLSAMENEKLPGEITPTTPTFTEKQKEYIRSAIEAAQTKEEMDRIEHQLRVSNRFCSCDIDLLFSLAPFHSHLMSMVPCLVSLLSFVSNLRIIPQDQQPQDQQPAHIRW